MRWVDTLLSKFYDMCHCVISSLYIRTRFSFTILGTIMTFMEECCMPCILALWVEVVPCSCCPANSFPLGDVKL